MGREGGGGGQFTSNLGPGWTRIAPHRKEGFQVSKRVSGARGTWQGELTKGDNKGSKQGMRHMLSVVTLYICTMLLCECG
jgi:hypothetical protein